MTIEKVGLLVIREGRVLLCRKKHTTALLILPGGKRNPGEDPVACLRREVVEELGPVEVSALSYLGRYTDQAAGEPGKTVVIELYRGELAGEPAAASEIRELVWFPESGNREELAPSIRNRILPDLVQRQILPWSLPFKSN